jgi:hypothetical protein
MESETFDKKYVSVYLNQSWRQYDTVCARNRGLHKQRHWTENFFLIFDFVWTTFIDSDSLKFKAQAIAGTRRRTFLRTCW